MPEDKNKMSINGLVCELNCLSKRLLTTRDIVEIGISEIRGKEDDENEIHDIAIKCTEQELVQEIRALLIENNGFQYRLISLLEKIGE